MGELPSKLDFLHPEKDRRRSQRVLIVIPVLMSWTNKDGVRIKEEAQTEVISRHGAMVRVKGSMMMGSDVELTRPQVHQSTKAKVVWVGKPDAEGFVRVGLELTIPTPEFWGVYLPPPA